MSWELLNWQLFFRRFFLFLLFSFSTSMVHSRLMSGLKRWSTRNEMPKNWIQWQFRVVKRVFEFFFFFSHMNILFALLWMKSTLNTRLTGWMMNICWRHNGNGIVTINAIILHECIFHWKLTLIYCVTREWSASLQLMFLYRSKLVKIKLWSDWHGMLNAERWIIIISFPPISVHLISTTMTKTFFKWRSIFGHTTKPLTEIFVWKMKLEF